MNFPFPVLVCDVGGTNARFALAPTPTAPLTPAIHLATAAYPGLEAAFEDAAGRLPQRPRSLIVCAAGPVEGRKVKMTNTHWIIDGAQVVAQGNLEQGLLFNDFEAQALSLPALQPDWLRTIGQPAAAAQTGTQLILGPGTGLGTAALLDVDGRYFALASEAGHIDFGPKGAEEEAIWPHIETAPVGRIRPETILCGPGLVRLHRARLMAAGMAPAELDSAGLIDRAHADRNGEEARTVELFCLLLARFAGDMALAFMTTGGVTFSGGILPRIADFIDPQKFRERFEDKSPFRELLQRIGTRLIVHDDSALAGMAATAAAPERYAIDYARRAWR